MIFSSRLTNKWDEALLLISADLLPPAAPHPSALAPLELAAVVLGPELSEPGIPTVDLTKCISTTTFFVTEFNKV